jgi:hypothetical protein
MPKPKQQRVFLNIPYDKQFERTYLAYVTALSAMGFLPRATLGIGGNRRLDRIASLIESCSYSIHDLSRVQLNRNAHAHPVSTCRLNLASRWRGLAPIGTTDGLSSSLWSGVWQNR